MIKFTVGGSTQRTEAFLRKMERGDLFTNLKRFGDRGVQALRAATPRDSGATAEAWTCEVSTTGGNVTLWWKNTNVVNGFNVAIGLQYGHGTGTGGWVAGYDYINPALRPIFDEIANDVWKEVQRA